MTWLQWITFLPILFGAGVRSQTLPAWDWPGQGWGVGPAYEAVTKDTTLPGWWYDWAPACRDARQIPMVWAASDRAAVLACNDGRPVLVLNEPERADQANTPPEQAADLLYQVASQWTGEVWCCGTDVTATAYALAVVDSYERRYGRWPATGWHAHAYANNTLTLDSRGWVSAAEYATLTAPRRAEATLCQADAFAAALRARGVLGRGVILSEYGALSNTWHFQPDDLVPLYQAFRVGIARREYIVSVAWFTAYDWRFDASNLLTADRRLTALGRAFCGRDQRGLRRE